MAFQILNKKNKPLTMRELDKEAAEFWSVEITDHYVAPKNRDWTESWYNFIGHTISNLPKGRHDWSDIIGDLCRVASIGETNYDAIIGCINYYKPYIELCLHWKLKGYKSVSC